MTKKNLIPDLWLVIAIGLIWGKTVWGSSDIRKHDSFEGKAIEEISSVSQGVRTNRVLLRGLDKITARVSDLEVTLGKAVNFGNLEITARFCQKSAPEDPPESVAFLEITEHKPGETPVPVFAGWMFSSSPTISAMEHPVYDIWVKECRGEPLRESSSTIVPPLSPSLSASPLLAPSSSSPSSLDVFKRGFKAQPQ